MTSTYSARVYIDFERYGEKVIEVSCILVFRQKVISIFHKMVYDHIPDTESFTMQSKFCHCIDPTILAFYGEYEDDVKSALLHWFKSFTFKKITIAGHGDDVSQKELIKWMPELQHLSNLEYAQVNLPPWNERHGKVYHMVTYHMKQHSNIFPCHHSQHTLSTELPYKKACNLSGLQKYMYGFHCSLFDCFELAFYEEKLPLYTSDHDFCNNVMCRNDFCYRHSSL
jgi:hypothetical protein